VKEWAFVFKKFVLALEKYLPRMKDLTNCTLTKSVRKNQDEMRR